jgi:hypothetical protein
MKLTLERIKQLIKEELQSINESEEKLTLSKEEEEEVKKAIFAKIDKKDIAKGDTWKDVLLSKNKGNGQPHQYKGTTYYGEI